MTRDVCDADLIDDQRLVGVDRSIMAWRQRPWHERGAMLLGHTGLLDGRHATTHWRSLDWMRESFPNVTVETQQHVVEDGNVLTSAGIDMALRVVARYFGEAVGRATARHMEYPYPDDNRRRV